MNNKKINKQSGLSLLGILVLGFILILVLSYFNISVKSVVQSPTGQENINYVKGTGETVWQKYLQKPAAYLWNDVFVAIFWQSFISNMERIRDGKPTDYQQVGENLSPVK